MCIIIIIYNYYSLLQSAYSKFFSKQNTSFRLLWKNVRKFWGVQENYSTRDEQQKAACRGWLFHRERRIGMGYCLTLDAIEANQNASEVFIRN